MKVTCAECATSFMLDDLLVGARGARVRCTECGTVFRVQPATGGSLAELGAALPDEPWRVQRGSVELHFASVSELSRAILAGHVHENDILSRGLLPARRLGEVLELLSFFARARRPDPDERVQTLPGLSDPDQRAAIERARAEVQQMQAASAAAKAVAEAARAPEPVRFAAPAPVPIAVLPSFENTPSPEPVRAAPVVAPVLEPESAPAYEPEPSAPVSEPEPAIATLALGMTADEGLPAMVPEAAVSPPFLPEDLEPGPSSARIVAAAPRLVDDLPVPPAPGWDSTPAPRELPESGAPSAGSDTRRARLRTAVVSVLAAAAVLLVGGLVARSLRQPQEPELARPIPSAAPLAPVAVVAPAESLAPSAAPIEPVAAEPAPAGPVPVVAAASAEPVAAPVPSASAASAGHRGDPQNLPTVDPRRMVADGARALRRGELGKAEEAFQHAIDKNPYDSEALSGLGDLARIRGQHDKAREIYAQVLSVNPSYLPALLALADLAWASGDRNEARRGYEYIVGHYPESAYPGRVKQRSAEEAAP